MQGYSISPAVDTLICTDLCKAIPNALSIYAFDSGTQGTANADSDLDPAILVAGCADPLQLFDTANQLANKLGYEVDLLDLRAASGRKIRRPNFLRFCPKRKNISGCTTS